MTNTDTQQSSVDISNKSPKSGLTTLLLCIFMGVFGVHRFYVGKIWTGILMFITFGCLGIWSFIDAVSIISNTFEDKQGRPLTCLTKTSSLKKTINIILVAIIELMIIVFMFIILVMYLTNDLVKTIEQHLDALRMNDIQKSYSLTSKTFQQSTTLDKFKQFINQYPILKNNESISISKREVSNHEGKLLGTLKAKNGTAIRVEYLLIYEDGQWKILGILINPKETDNSNESNALFTVNAEVSMADKKTDVSSDSASNELYIYKDQQAKFSSVCLKTWNYGSKRVGSFFCTGKKGTPSYQTFINVNRIATKKPDGKYLTVSDYINIVKKQILKIDSNATFIDQGNAELPQNPKQFKGEYLLSTFTYKNQPFKRLEFVISRDNQSVLYDWSYTSTQAQYDKDLPFAKKVYESMIIQP